MLSSDFRITTRPSMWPQWLSTVWSLRPFCNKLQLKNRLRPMLGRCFLLKHGNRHQSGPKPPKRRRKRRVSPLTDQFCGAPSLDLQVQEEDPPGQLFPWKMMLTCARQAAQLSPKKDVKNGWRLTQRSARLRALCMSTLGLKCPKSASVEKTFNNS